MKPRAVGWSGDRGHEPDSDALERATRFAFSAHQPCRPPYASPADQAEAEQEGRVRGSDAGEAELSRVLALRKQGWSTAAILERQQAVTEEAQVAVTTPRATARSARA